MEMYGSKYIRIHTLAEWYVFLQDKGPNTMLLTGTLAPWIHVRIITFLTVTHTVVKFPTPKYNSVFCSGPNYIYRSRTHTHQTYLQTWCHYYCTSSRVCQSCCIGIHMIQLMLQQFCFSALFSTISCLLSSPIWKTNPFFARRKNGAFYPNTWGLKLLASWMYSRKIVLPRLRKQCMENEDAHSSTPPTKLTSIWGMSEQILLPHSVWK